MKTASISKCLVPLIILSVSLLTSCVNTKRLSYFRDLPESSQANEIAIADFVEPKIQPDDILAININTIDPQATNAINSRNGGVVSVGVNSQLGMVNTASGYLVNKDGTVDIPTLGRVKLAGLTTSDARDVVRTKATESFKNPVVDVRFANFRVTIIGEVNKPASYIIPNEQVSVLDAIGYAGDLTIYGKRENILLIRKDAIGKNISVKLDLTKKGTLTSPYFYLRQNDVIYVEPNKTKVLNNDNNVIKFITAGATIFTAIVLGIRYL